jgi:hypothetical protein
MRKLATVIWHMLSKRLTYAACRAAGEAGTRASQEQGCGRE